MFLFLERLYEFDLHQIKRAVVAVWFFVVSRRNLLGGHDRENNSCQSNCTCSFGAEIGSDIGHSTTVLSQIYCRYCAVSASPRMKGSLLARRGICIASSL